MPRISLWNGGRHSNDYKFFDARISEMFTLGATDVLIHKYLGPQTAPSNTTVTQTQHAVGNTLTVSNITGAIAGYYISGSGVPYDTKILSITGNVLTLSNTTTSPVTANTVLAFSSIQDASQPTYINQSALNIQDLLFMENRDRVYDSSIYQLRGRYNVQDLDMDLSQFGLFLQNDTVFITFHLNDMVNTLGRKLMSGDVLELPHLKDFFALDETVPVALKRFYVVKDATRPAEGYSPTWWPHLWRVKAGPLVDSQEYKQILNQIQAGTAGQTLGNILSTQSALISINDSVITEAENQVPLSGYDTSPFWIPLMENGDKNATPLRPGSSPEELFQGYLATDGTPANGYSYGTGTEFPNSPSNGDYYLRTDFRPHRLFRFTNNKWSKVQDAVRTNLTPGTGETQRDTFINNNDTFVNDQGITEPIRQNISKLLKPGSDY